MRFIHTADIHLGMMPEADNEIGKKRQNEIFESFRRLIMVAEEEKADLLLIAGDLFHRQPKLSELKEINYEFSRLSHTRVVFIAGNHDYISKSSYYNNFSFNDNVYFLKSREIESVYFEDINTRVYGCSYYTRENTDNIYDNIQVENISQINILLAHGGDASHIPMDIKRLEQSRFDYVAAGHIHKPYISDNLKFVYSGGLEPLDRTETGERGYIRGVIEEGNFDIQFVPFSIREYVNIEVESDSDMTNGRFKNELANRIHMLGEDNMYNVLIRGVRDEHIEYNIEDIMQVGNIVHISDETTPDYDFSRLREENSDNIIGLYIDDIESADGDDTIKNKALYYGIAALLNS